MEYSICIRNLFICLLAAVLLNSCTPEEPKEPVARDTSRDDPKKVAEIAKLTGRKDKASRTYKEKGAFGPIERSSWTIYKLEDKRDLTTSALQINVTVLPGQKSKIWLETRLVSPELAMVTKMLINTAKDQMISGPDDGVRVPRLERQIVWNESEAVAREWSDEQIAQANNMAKALGSTMFPRQPDVTPKVKEAVTPAGRFTNCYISRQEKIWILVEEEESCYSSAVPLPYIVEIESESNRQKLIDFGLGAKPSMIPKNIKVIKE